MGILFIVALVVFFALMKYILFPPKSVFDDVKRMSCKCASCQRRRGLH